MDLETLALAKSFTKKSLEGMGALAGKNCTVQSVTPVAGGHRITLAWTEDDGTAKTQSFDVMDGADGERGEKGDKGEKGDPGERGEKGSDGATGAQGAQGAQGLQGIQGIQGEKGEKGDPGAQGLQGIQGIKGDKGDDGYPFLIYKEYETIGDFDAADFPEIGLMFLIKARASDPDSGEDLGFPIYRFTGAEETPPYSLITYMNTSGIKGEKGDKGDQGEQGIQGEKGEKGDKGDTGAQGEQGIQGEKGIQGLQGEKGDDGFSPSASVTQLSDGAVIEITDKSGTTSATVRNVAGELIPSVSYYQKGTSTIPAGTVGRYSVTLPNAMPDSDYVVVFEPSYINGEDVNAGVQVHFTDQTVTGFDLWVFGTPSDHVKIKWEAFKLMTDAALLADEQAIAQNASDIAEVKAKIPSSASASNQLVTKNDIYTTTAFARAGNAVGYRKAEIKYASPAGVIQVTTKSGDVYYISKRDGTSIKFTKVVNGVGGDAATISGYAFDATSNVLTLYLTMNAWSSLRLDALNAWSASMQNGTTITVSEIEQSEMGGTAPTIVDVATDTLQETSITLALTDNSADNMTLRLHKMGKMVVAEGVGVGAKAGTVKTSWAVAGNLPAGYRPKNFEFTTLQHSSSTIGIQFNTNGAVALYDYTGDNSLGWERAIHITYFTA